MEPHRISLQICIEALRGLINAGVDKLHALIRADDLALRFYDQRRRAKTQIGIVLLTCIKLGGSKQFEGVAGALRVIFCAMPKATEIAAERPLLDPRFVENQNRLFQ